jgi:MFS family permease
MFLGLWGKWSDKFSNKSVLAVSCPLFLLATLGWAFTTLPDRYFLTMPLLFIIHILMGTSIAGVAIASGNISLKLAPKGEATSYLATNTLINSFSAGLAPLIGGKFADFFASRNLSMSFQWSGPVKDFTIQALNFQHWDFFFVFAFIVGLYALHRLSLVKEEGEVDDKIVRAEFLEVIKRPIKSLSSGAGLYQIISYPFSFLLRYRQQK